AFEDLLRRVDDDEGRVSQVHLLRYLLADTAVAANDVVLAQISDPDHQPPFAEDLAQVALDDSADESSEDIKRRADAREQQHDGVNTAIRIERARLAVAHSRNRDHCHVQRVDYGPALDDDITERAQQDDAD